MKLSIAQRRMLERLASGDAIQSVDMGGIFWRNPPKAIVSTATLTVLHRLSYVDTTPTKHYGRTYRINEAGRAALATPEGK